MTAKQLIEQLSKVAPDSEIVGGMFNGRVNSYTVLDDLHVFSFETANELRDLRSKFNHKCVSDETATIVIS